MVNGFEECMLPAKECRPSWAHLLYTALFGGVPGVPAVSYRRRCGVYGSIKGDRPFPVSQITM